MDFRVGDTVIHWTLGLGEVIGLEERSLSGESTLYYLVKIRDITVFMPADGKSECRLRSPSTPDVFRKLLEIFSEPGMELSENRFERKAYLQKNLSDGTAESMCRVIRDLTHLARTKHLSDDDKNVLERASNLFRSEMTISLNISTDQAESQFNQLLLQQVPLAV